MEAIPAKVKKAEVFSVTVEKTLENAGSTKVSKEKEELIWITPKKTEAFIVVVETAEVFEYHWRS